MAPEDEAQALRALGTACLRVWWGEAPEHTELDSQTETPGAAPGSGGGPGCVAGSGGRGGSQEPGLLGLLRLGASGTLGSLQGQFQRRPPGLLEACWVVQVPEPWPETKTLEPAHKRGPKRSQDEEGVSEVPKLGGVGVGEEALSKKNSAPAKSNFSEDMPFF